jgi:hypothetical protein
MRQMARWNVLFAVLLLGNQAQAQPQAEQAQPRAQLAACEADFVCISAPLAAGVGLDKPSEPSNAYKREQLERCAEGPVDVTAASVEERRLVCSAAHDAVQRLGRCEIPLRRPLDVQIVNEVRHPLSREPIFGFFDTKRERVIISREAAIPSLAEGTPYAELPQRDFYRSLIVHEVVHGVMHQNLKRSATSHAAYEYPAYALQMDSLPPDVRDRFLSAIPNRARSGELVLNDAILFFDPFFFAVHAYEHLKSAADGCAQLHALLEGNASFVPNLPP